MTEGEKNLMKYALSLKYYCKSHKDCEKCIFYHVEVFSFDTGFKSVCVGCLISDLGRYEGVTPKDWLLEGRCEPKNEEIQIL